MNEKIINTIKKGVLNNKHYTLKPIETPIKLNQNESPYDLPQHLKNCILDKIKKTKWNIYPDFIPDYLYEKIANYYSLKKDNILIGNGSNEMIFTILAATVEKEKNIIIPDPTFTVYKLISSNLNGTIHNIMLNDDFSFNTQKIIEKCKIKGSVTIICSPNNPTGTYMNKNDIIQIIENSNGLVIIDEAYIHFGGETVLDLINKYENLIVLRTFSKAFGLAGLRIGIMFSNEQLIKEISKVKLPYNLNILTLTTLDVIFDNLDFVDENIKKIVDERKRLEKELIKFNSIKFIPSYTNFFLIKFNDSKYIFNELVKEGILVRDVSNYPMLENCLRISIGLKEENDKLIESLKKIID